MIRPPKYGNFNCWDHSWVEFWYKFYVVFIIFHLQPCWKMVVCWRVVVGEVRRDARSALTRTGSCRRGTQPPRLCCLPVRANYACLLIELRCLVFMLLCLEHIVAVYSMNMHNGLITQNSSWDELRWSLAAAAEFHRILQQIALLESINWEFAGKISGMTLSEVDRES